MDSAQLDQQSYPGLNLSRHRAARLAWTAVPIYEIFFISEQYMTFILTCLLR